jgi:hypothetical protein
MKKNGWFFISLVTIAIFYSCTQREKIDCEMINEMGRKDQLYRGDIRGNPWMHIQDSLSGHDTSLYETNMERAIEIYAADKDTSFGKGFLNVRVSDSIWALQSAIDAELLTKAIALIKDHKNNRIDTMACVMDIQLILRMRHLKDLMSS